MPDFTQQCGETVTDVQAITDASAPFDRADADLILRTSDNVNFRVIKVLLAMGSPFFEDMFSLPQSASDTAADDGSEMKDGLSVVPVSETARTLEMLLLMCYPLGAVEQPVLDRIEDVNWLLDAAIKYSFGSVEKRLREALIAPQFLQDNAVGVFAVACRHKMISEAKAAARAALEKPIDEAPLGPEVDMLSGANLLRLLKYHKACIRSAREAIAIHQATNVAPSSARLGCENCDYMRSFEPVGGKTNTALAILESIPDTKEIEKASEKNWASLMRCTSCNWQTTYSAGLPALEIVRDLAASYSKTLEDAISVVS